MEIYLVLLSVLLLSSMTLTWLMSRESAKAQTTAAELAAGTVAKVVETYESQTQLLDKAIAILSTKDPMAFQALQVMNTQGLYTDGDRYDPSDEAEVDRLKAFGILPADEEGDLNGDVSPDEELEWLRTHGVPGADS